MEWIEVFAVLALSHLVGDFALQTEWQARNKHGGLGGDPTKRRALLAHTLLYTLAFVPALVWIGDERGAGVALAAAAAVAIPHMVQDDGRLVAWYMRAVKHTDPERNRAVGIALDQTIHAVVLFAIALAVTA
jgi:Protein of unknown function (DUF3307)